MTEPIDGIEFTDLPEPGTPDYDLRPPPPRHRHGTTLRTRKKVETAWNARVAGCSWAQAAEVAGYYDGAGARTAVMRVYGQLPGIDRDQLRTLWRERLEVTWREALRDVLDRKPGAVTAAVRVVTAAAQLDGLNEPVGVDVHVSATYQTLLAQIEEAVYTVPALTTGDTG